jgi:hypothetical protein
MPAVDIQVVNRSRSTGGAVEWFTLGHRALLRFDISPLLRSLVGPTDARTSLRPDLGICFNGDVPNGHTASPQELKVILHGYGEILKTAALVIRDPQYLLKAKIVTFGIAHSDDRYDKPAHHISHPAATFVAGLRNVDGFNYLDNSLYHVDGYGTHVYRWEGNVAGSVRNTLHEGRARAATHRWSGADKGIPDGRQS